MPPAPKPRMTAAQLERRLIDTLRGSGGEMQRNDVRIAINSNMRAAVFDAVVNDLINRGVIVAQQARVERVARQGNLTSHVAIVYRLSKRTRGG